MEKALSNDSVMFDVLASEKRQGKLALQNCPCLVMLENIAQEEPKSWNLVIF